MELNVSQVKTIAAGTAGAAVGSKVYGYVIRAAAADVTIEFIKTDKDGAVIWTDILDISLQGISRPFAFERPLGVQGTDALHCVVTGAAGAVDGQYD